MEKPLCSDDSGDRTIDWSPLSAIEALSLASHENMHTALWCWLLGKSSALSHAERLQVLTALTGLTNVENWELQAITREYTIKKVSVRLDLVMQYHDHQGTTHFVVVENKLKSSQGDHQLANYHEYFTKPIAKQGSKPEYHWTFLTLAGEKAKDDRWTNRSYRQLLVELRPLADKNMYLRDYVQYLERIVALVSGLESGETAWLFDDQVGVNPEMASYVHAMNLKALLQKVVLTKLSEEVEGKATWLSGSAIGETHGEGVLDLYLTREQHLGKWYQIGVQLQSRHAKLFVYPILEKKEGASPQQVQDAQNILQRFRQCVPHIETPSTKPKNNKTLGKGFTSIPLGTISYTTGAILQILAPFSQWQNTVVTVDSGPRGNKL